MAYTYTFKAVLAVATLTAAWACAHAGEAEPAVELDPITVTTPVAPLDRSLYLLRILLDRSAPCLGCDAVLRRPAARAPDLLGFLLQPPARELDEAGRIAREIRLHDAPELDYLRR